MAQALTQEGFDPARHPWSFLANGDLGWIQTANFVVMLVWKSGMATSLVNGAWPAVQQPSPSILLHPAADTPLRLGPSGRSRGGSKSRNAGRAGHQGHPAASRAQLWAEQEHRARHRQRST
ncbi:hypothetical protein [Nonomuraea sp. NPDC049480]|uniref:hypothetical protein n=1 Tax=Nonomuraea sp. NPDC049480 TaxID=3364353 RepID=UPI0037B8F35C